MLRLSCLCQTGFGENYLENKSVIYLRKKKEGSEEKNERIKWKTEHFPGPLMSCFLHGYEELSSYKEKGHNAFSTSDSLPCFVLFLV